MNFRCNIAENVMPSIGTPVFWFQMNEEKELCLAVASVLSDVSLSSSDVRALAEEVQP